MREQDRTFVDRWCICSPPLPGFERQPTAWQAPDIPMCQVTRLQARHTQITASPKNSETS